MEWKLPDLGEGIVEGEIVHWLVKEGDVVIEDQHLVEIMTDKATMELPIPISGKVTKILAQEGEIVKVGQALAHIADAGKVSKLSQEGFTQIDTKAAVQEKQNKNEPQQNSQFEKRKGKAMASPAVRALAHRLGVDLNSIEATGLYGRVSFADVERAARGLTHSSEISSREEHKPPIIIQGPVEKIPIRGLRRKIAEHMSISRKLTAHFTHMDEVDLTELKALREKQSAAAHQEKIKLTYLAYFVKAAAQALTKHAYLNASLDDINQTFILKKYYNIGIAVATDNGLMVPVIKNVDKLSLFEVAKEIVRLSDEARQGKIALDDLKGGTFTVTNIGSIGGILSVPIINYPEVAIMGFHEIKPRPVVRNNAIVIRDMMNISISGDHRVVDGAHVALFCKNFISLLENPTTESLSNL